MKKIIIAPDSFKGSVSAIEAAKIIEIAIKKVFPNCEVIKIPLADGGEGTLNIMHSAMNGKFISCKVKGPLMESLETHYRILSDGKTAVIEMATVCGLNLVPVSKRNPWYTTTFGMGEIIKDAIAKGCDNFLIGIGGSATSDGGTGMLQALGYKFLNKDGVKLGTGGKILNTIFSINDSQVIQEVKQAKFTIACDVDNPFSGINGAACVYARQKGADNRMIRALDKGLKNFAQIIRKEKYKDIEGVPGAGAAGGIGGAFLAFLNANLKPGIEMILESIDFDSLIKGADLIITGEGKLDKQTLRGKTPAGVLKAAKKQSIPVIAIGGGIAEVKNLNIKGFLGVLSIQPYPVSLKKAMHKEFSLKNIERSIEQQMRIIKYFQHINS